jgi:hypothetical protein
LNILQVDAPKHQTRLKVVLLSLPARTQAVLDFFFTSTGRGSFAPVPENQADAAIFDLDTLESRQHWLDFRTRTGRPGIALSVQPQDIEGAVWVRKPVTPAALLAAAADVHAGRWMRQVPATVAPVAPETTVLAVAPAIAPAEQAANAQPSLDTVDDPSAAAQAHLTEVMASLPEAAAPRAAEPMVPAPASEAPQLVVVDSQESSVAPVVVATEVTPEPVPQIAAPLLAPSNGFTPVPPAGAKSARPGGFTGLIRRFFGGGHQTASQAPQTRVSGPMATPATTPVSASRDCSVEVPAGVPPSAPLRAASDLAAEGTEVAPVTLGPSTIQQAPAPAEDSTASPESAIGEPEAPPTAPQVPEPATPSAPEASHSDARGRLLGGASTASHANDTALCGNRTDVPFHQLSEDPELRYDPDVHLVSALREAYLVGAKWQVPTHLECAAGRIVVDATRNLVLCDFDPDRLEALYATPLGKRPKTRTLNRQEQAEVQERPRDDAGTRRLDDMLWRAGLLTGSGRLPIDADPQRAIYLRQWPNLTRISAIPNAVRIAALWSARGASLAETTQLLNIPQRHVIAFYNGALALDLITEDGSHIHRAQRKAGRNRGLLSRLLGWLR